MKNLLTVILTLISCNIVSGPYTLEPRKVKKAFTDDKLKNSIPLYFDVIVSTFILNIKK